MTKDDLKEEIRHEGELLRLAWVTAVAAGGGSIGILLGGVTPLRSALAGAGFLVTLVFIVTALRQERQVRTLLRQMQETL